MKVLVLLTQIYKCSFLLDISNQSDRIAWFKLPECRDICMQSGTIGLHYYSDQACYIERLPCYFLGESPAPTHSRPTATPTPTSKFIHTERKIFELTSRCSPMRYSP